MTVAAEHLSVIRRPLVTEKSHQQMAGSIYAFEVATGANKYQIKAAVEAIWNVKVASVRTVNTKGEQRRNRFGNYTTKGGKKAYIRLKEGYAIELA